MKIYDISVTTTPETITWEGTEKGQSVEWLAMVGPDSVASLSTQSFGSHTGTHLDAPLHFVPGGKSVEQLDLDALVGPVELVHVHGDVIGAADLEAAKLPSDTRRVIFKTRNTDRGLMAGHEFARDYVGVGPDAAQWLVDRGYVLVGIDYLSVGPYGAANVATHRILLGAEVVLVEGLSLAHVAPGRYVIAVLPPKFAGVEGSPCRAILMEER